MPHNVVHNPFNSCSECMPPQHVLLTAASVDSVYFPNAANERERTMVRIIFFARFVCVFGTCFSLLSSYVIACAHRQRLFSSVSCNASIVRVITPVVESKTYYGKETEAQMMPMLCRISQLNRYGVVFFWKYEIHAMTHVRQLDEGILLRTPKKSIRSARASRQWNDTSANE